MTTIRALMVLAIASLTMMTWEARADSKVSEGCLRLDAASVGDVARQLQLKTEWHLLDTGDEFAEPCELRTSAFGVARFEFSDGRLALGPNSRVVWEGTRLDVKHGQVVLFLKEGAASWIVEALHARTEVAAASECEIEIVSGHDSKSVVGRVLSGVAKTRWQAGTEREVRSKAFRWEFSTGEFSESELPKRDSGNEVLKRKRQQDIAQLTANDPTTGLRQRLHVAQYHINVVIDPPVALVQIDQSFYSPFDQQSEGTFVFDLPDGASVSRFAMFTAPDRLIEGELIGKPQARQIYDSIVHARRDPAILEQIDRHTFRMQVFPIFPKDTKRVLLDFTMPLTELPGGEYSFRLPLLGDEEPIWDFKLTGSIRGEVAPKSLRSPTHGRATGWSVRLNEPGKTSDTEPVVIPTSTFRFEATDYRADKDFIARFHLPKGEATRLRYEPVSNDPIDGDCFMLSVPSQEVVQNVVPELKQQKRDDGVDVLILADTSSSMSPLRPQQRRVIESVLMNLRDQDRFRLSAIDVEVRSATKNNEWFDNNEMNRRTALEWLDREVFVGKSNFEETLPVACDSHNGFGRRRVVLYVGDGARASQFDKQSEALIASAKNRKQPKFAAVMVGESRDSVGVVEEFARESGGLVFGSDRSSRREFFRWLLGDLPMPLRLSKFDLLGVMAHDLEQPRGWMPGTHLRLMGRMEGGSGVRGTVDIESLDGKKAAFWIQQVSRDNGRRDHFVGRMCVQRRLERMQAGLKQDVLLHANQQANQALTNEIVALSRQWTVLCPQTAFLVLETENDYAVRHLTRAVRRPYWKPLEAVADPKTATIDVAAALRRQQVRATEKLEARPAVSEQLAEVRKALQEHNVDQAVALAQSLRGPPQQSAAVRELLQQVDAEAARRAGRETAQQMLGRDVRLFQRPAARRPLARIDEQRSAIAITNAPLVEQLFPKWAEKLITPPQVDEISFAVFYDWFSKETGQRCMLDVPAFEAGGVAIDTPVRLGIKQPIPAISLLNHVNRQVSVGFDFRSGFIRVSTIDELNQQLSTLRFPVADLVDPSVPLAQERLELPALDRELNFRRQVQSALKKPCKFSFSETPLSKVVDAVSEDVGLPLVLDLPALDAAGVAVDRPVTLDLKGQPTNVVMREALKPHNLDIVVGDQLVHVTTVDEANNRLETRFHSTRGLLIDSAATKRLQQASEWGGTRGGMFGGDGFGGGGFGGGGLGGGGLGGGGLGGGIPAGAFGGSMGHGGGATATPNNGPMPQSNLINGDLGADDSPKFDTGRSGGTPSDGDGATGITSSGQQLSLQIEQTQTVHRPEALSLLMTEQTSGGWESDGSGTGDSSYLPMIRGFVVRQTAQVHAEIEDIFEGLRKEAKAADAHSHAVNLLEASDVHDNAFALQSMVAAETSGGWEFEGSGTGTLAYDDQTRTLIVRQTYQVQREVLKLLTQLRRERYRNLYGHEWQPGSKPTSTLPLQELLHVDLQTFEPQPALKPDPARGQLASVPVRREPEINMLSVWRHTVCDTFNRDPLGSASSRRLGFYPDPSVVTPVTTARNIESPAHSGSQQGTEKLNGQSKATQDSGVPSVGRSRFDRSNEGNSKVEAVVTGVTTDIGRDGIPTYEKTARGPVGAKTSAADSEEPSSLTKFLVLPAAIETQTGHRFLCIESERAAVFDPLTQLVMIGTWGRDARLRLNEQLPWLPHLSNADLAKQFFITQMQDYPQSVRVRLTQPQAGATEFVSYHEVTFSKTHGLPTQWDAYLAGALSYRLLFEELSKDATPHWQRVRCVDALGRELERWELIERQPATSLARAAANANADASQTAAVAEAMPLRAGWQRAIVIDFDRMADGEKSSVDSLIRALQLIDAQDWSGALKQLDAAQQRWPENGFLRVLEAWCWSQSNEAKARHGRIVSLLRAAMNGDGAELLKELLLPNGFHVRRTCSPSGSVTDGLQVRRTGLLALQHVGDVPPSAGMFGLSTQELYDLFSRQPESQRDASDHLTLADLACLAGRMEAALQHLDAAEKAFGKEVPPEVTVMRARALRESERVADLVQLATAALTNEATVSEVLLGIANETRRALERELTEKLITASLDRAKEPGRCRSGLLAQAAELRTGLPRWRLLLEALEHEHDDVQQLQSVWAQLRGELQEAAEHPEMQQLIEASKNEVVQQHLVRMAALNESNRGNDQRAGDLLWSQWEAGVLPIKDEVWLFELCLKTRQMQRAKRMFEVEVRRPIGTPDRFLGVSSELLQQEWKIDGSDLKARIESAREDVPIRNWPANWHSFPRPTLPGSFQGGGFF